VIVEDLAHSQGKIPGRQTGEGGGEDEIKYNNPSLIHIIVNLMESVVL
jgi:hypothetical protein